MLLFVLFTIVVHADIAHADIADETVRRLINFPPTDACDNFYRHACPLNSTKLVTKYAQHAQRLAREFFKSPFFQYEILTDFASFDNIFNTEVYPTHWYGRVFLYDNFTVDGFLDIYSKQCEAKRDTKHLLEYFERLFTIPTGYQEQCSGNSFCASHLAKDPNCARVRDLLKEEMNNWLVAAKYYKKIETEDVHKYISESQKTLQLNYLKMIGAELMETNPNLKNGIKVFHEMFEDIKKLYKDWIAHTKWVVNNDAVPYLLSILDKLTVIEKLSSLKKEVGQSLKKADHYYRKCRKEISINGSHVNALCFLCSFEREGFRQYDSALGVVGYADARTTAPFLYISLSVFLAADEIKTEAGRIGFLGSTIAHEIGHSFIEDFSKYRALAIPFFSKNVTNCIQQTFRNTCDEFKEKSCTVEPQQVDENGSDFLSSQVAYAYFRNVMGKDYDKIYKPLNITQEQLFFYAMSMFDCSAAPSEQPKNWQTGQIDNHSAENIRVNVRAQIPEFGEAFGCSKDSRMIKVIKEPCYIYGPNAPQIKRRRLIG